MSIPLHEKRILITREGNQAKEFSEKVIQHGGKPIEIPLLKISCKDIPENKQQLQNIHHYKWIFFTSSNGVACFFQLANQYKWMSNVFDKIKFATVGHKTAQTLEAYGCKSDFIPSIYNADAMATEFTARYTVIDEPLLIVRGNKSREVLPDWFTKHKIRFDTIEVYETTYNFRVKDELNQLLNQNKLDFITFTSPSAVEAFSEMKDGQIRKNQVFVCIGTTTKKRALEFGITNTLTPEQFTIDGMLEQIIDYIARKG
ncbi:uroporphyrinogen-III synthase [Virgibacillus subterraneus]|uniref:Uroporphyrinogen-III synthase n=1 Tax=Virgibacillus subterraneus TaxID=621109 RepID=A0A1H9DLA8_9BACI|nr:uroporphyrinogen-III synthase [Virgibacillus subterraneus]SEQ14097.1 uroporphyrinogen-III synthase [Virgibacillus subterraneus]